MSVWPQLGGNPPVAYPYRKGVDVGAHEGSEVEEKRGLVRKFELCGVEEPDLGFFVGETVVERRNACRALGAHGSPNHKAPLGLMGGMLVSIVGPIRLIGQWPPVCSA
jgi:hypothetical protein